MNAKTSLLLAGAGSVAGGRSGFPRVPGASWFFYLDLRDTTMWCHISKAERARWRSPINSSPSSIGGLMVQLHAAKAGVPLNRPTLDVDIVLHIETGAAVFNEVKKQLEDLGYELRWSLQDDDPIHRFIRGPGRRPEIVDVMVADHLAPKHVPKLKGHPVFQAPRCHICIAENQKLHDRH